MKRWLRRTMAIALGLTLGWMAAGYSPMVWNAQAQPTTLPQSESMPAAQSAKDSAAQPSATQPAPPDAEQTDGPRVGSAKRFRVIDLGKRAAQLLVVKGEPLRMVELMLAAALGLLLLAALVGPWLKSSRDAGAKEEAEHNKSGH